MPWVDSALYSLHFVQALDLKEQVDPLAFNFQDARPCSCRMTRTPKMQYIMIEAIYIKPYKLSDRSRFMLHGVGGVCHARPF